MTPRRSAALALAVVLVAVAAALFATSKTHTSAGADAVVGSQAATVLPASAGTPLPSLAAATAWDNTTPLTAADLEGKVVLVDFWDASCINCRRTFAFLRQLQSTYAAQGLVIIGVHSPEFAFEKSHAYVAEQVKELGVTWPVAEDPDMAVWNAFGNEYWPADYLADRNGLVRYGHVGEGDDAQIESAVRTLLAEGGTAGSATVGAVPQSQQPPSGGEDVTPETYLGSDHGDLTDVVTLSAGTARQAEYADLEPGRSVTLRFRAKDVYVVLAPGAPGASLAVALDGRPIASSRGPDVSAAGVIAVTHQDLFHVVSAAAVTDGTLTLTATGAGVQAYSFTFGG